MYLQDNVCKPSDFFAEVHHFSCFAAGNLHNSLLNGKVQMQRYPALANMEAKERLKGTHSFITS
jgi:hypothetical protein